MYGLCLWSCSVTGGTSRVRGRIRSILVNTDNLLFGNLLDGYLLAENLLYRVGNSFLRKNYFQIFFDTFISYWLVKWLIRLGDNPFIRIE